MSLLFLDGFDHYATADIAKKWSQNNGATIAASGGRRGGGAMLCNSTLNHCTKTIPDRTSLVIGAAITFASLPTGVSAPLFQMFSSGVAQCEVRVNSAGLISVTRNGTALAGGASSFALVPGIFYYIEWKFTIADSIAANSCVVRVNGAEVINVTAGQDTKNATDSTVNQLRVGNTNGLGSVILAGLVIDDMYVCDQAGAKNNDFLGDVRIDTIFPTSDGANSDWTPSSGSAHYALVDDATPNTTDYVESGTSGQRDTFGFGNIAHTPSAIFGTQICIAAHKDDAGARSLKAVTRPAATDYSGVDQPIGTTQFYYSEIRETDPETAAAWTKSGLNATEFGVECA